MNNDLLLLIKKHTGTLIGQTNTKPQETLKLKLNKQMDNFAIFHTKFFLKKENGS